MSAWSSTTIPVEEHCDIKRVRAMIGQSKTFVYERMADPENPFPRPRRIGRKSMWRLSDVQAWLAAEWERSERVGRRVGHHSD